LAISVLLEICTSVDPWPARGYGAGQGDDPVGDGGQVAVMGHDPDDAARKS
jgi:hypothetical protein